MSDMLWGGRFESGPHPEMIRITSSIDVDIRLLEQDVRVTKAHARTLVKAGLLDASELSAIDAVCDSLPAEWKAGSLRPAPGDEDVHSLVERVLTERLGETGERIHAGRSRNDLVATDMRLFCKERAKALATQAADLVDAMAGLAEMHLETVMPAYTHLQRAQPVSLAFHLAAHGFALHRDGKRFATAAETADSSALGAGAVAGTTLPLDVDVAAFELGFMETFDNAMDAVSDRDYIADLLYACALCGVHLSRLAEEIVLWTSAEFGFARLSDEWSTGSSMMPQKRNPDLAELVRGRAGPTVGDLMSLLMTLKGLPLAYNRDLQEDKRGLFASVDRTSDALTGTIYLLRSLTFDVERMASAAGAAGTWATDVAERLVEKAVPFRTAHGVAGALVAHVERAGVEPGSLTSDDLKALHPMLESSDVPGDPSSSMRARTSHGGTAPERVREQLASLRGGAEFLRDRVR
jgi:argininosuccinate lyase